MRPTELYHPVPIYCNSFRFKLFSSGEKVRRKSRQVLFWRSLFSRRNFLMEIAGDHRVFNKSNAGSKNQKGQIIRDFLGGILPFIIGNLPIGSYFTVVAGISECSLNQGGNGLLIFNNQYLYHIKTPSVMECISCIKHFSNIL